MMDSFVDERINYGLGSLCALGGLMGYAKARSVPSLIAGLSFGVTYGYCAYLIQNNQIELGTQAATATSILLMTVMGARAFRTKKLMPAGPLSALGLFGTIVNGYTAKQMKTVQ